jgi:hypothetical protein
MHNAGIQSLITRLITRALITHLMMLDAPHIAPHDASHSYQQTFEKKFEKESIRTTSPRSRDAGKNGSISLTTYTVVFSLSYVVISSCC